MSLCLLQLGCQLLLHLQELLFLIAQGLLAKGELLGDRLLLLEELVLQ